MTTLFLDLEVSSLRSPSPFYRDFSRGLFFNFFAFNYYSVSKINPLNFFGHLVNFYMHTFSLFKTRHHSLFTKDQPQDTFSQPPTLKIKINPFQKIKIDIAITLSLNQEKIKHFPLQLHLHSITHTPFKSTL